MGADEAVLLSDAGLEGSDVWATSYAMAHALKKTGFDLLIVGGLTDDGSTGAVPGALAEHLGLPCITNARKAEIAGGKLQVERETDTGYQNVSGPLPALLTTALTFGEPRYASLKGIMGAKKKTIETLTVGDLGLDQAVGESGSKTQLLAFAPPPVRGKGEVVEAGDGPTGAKIIFDFLQATRRGLNSGRIVAHRGAYVFDRSTRGLQLLHGLAELRIDCQRTPEGVLRRPDMMAGGFDQPKVVVGGRIIGV